ncbi:MAG: alkaline phosphatase PhoX [Planctomycetaceae bacterium]
MKPVSRRAFLRLSSAAAGSVSVCGAFHSLLARAARGDTKNFRIGYGALRAAKDEATGLELIRLPEGFTYKSYGWTGDRMSNGILTPGAPDGMAVIDARDNGILTLCRNHELRSDGRPFGKGAMVYDGWAQGGCTHLKFDGLCGEWLSAEVSLAGTVRNCAGGLTPWGSWLSCEEVVGDPGEEHEGRVYHYRRDHGWIFEVPADARTRAVPLKDMGRFVHEAVAVDPDTGIVYETEDRGTAGFYRFIPNEPGRLAAGGRLEMLKVRGSGDLSKGVDPDGKYFCEWVAIQEPHRGHSPGERDSLGVFNQGAAQGGTRFARLEGCWYGNGVIYFVSTSGGNSGNGQVWRYDPVQSVLSLVFESPSSEVLERPDNIAVSPRGGIILCEDGDLKPQRLHGLTPDGQLFMFAANNVVLRGERNGFQGDFRGEEWAGACFSPDGKWLFANLMDPGITFAITGPWSDNGL